MSAEVTELPAAPPDPFQPSAPPAAVEVRLGDIELFENGLTLPVLFSGPPPDPRALLRQQFEAAQAEWKASSPEYADWQAAAEALAASEKELTEASAELDASRLAWTQALGTRENYKAAEARYRAAKSAGAVIEERIGIQRSLVAERKQVALTTWNSVLQGVINGERLRIDGEVPALRAAIGRQLDAEAFIQLYEAIAMGTVLAKGSMAWSHMQGLVPPL